MTGHYFENTTDKEFEDVVKVSKRIAAIGLDAGVGGNISIRLAGGKGILITASGAGVLDEPADSYLEVDFEGQPLSRRLTPSKDLAVHLDIYKKCPQVNAIIHTHSPVATFYSINAKEIPLLTVVSQKLVSLPILETDTMERTEQGKFIGAYLNKFTLSGIIMKKHGVVSTGKVLLKTQKTAELIELTAKIALYAGATGR